MTDIENKWNELGYYCTGGMSAVTEKGFERIKYDYGNDELSTEVCVWINTAELDLREYGEKKETRIEEIKKLVAETRSELGWKE